MSITSPRLLASDTVVNAALPNAETICAQLDGISTPGGGGTVMLHASLDVSVAASGTGGALRIRRGTTTGGAVVMEYGTLTLVGGDRYSLVIDALDNPGEVAGQSYVVTIGLAGQASSGTLNAVYFSATY